jgi:hypothetical protein
VHDRQTFSNNVPSGVSIPGSNKEMNGSTSSGFDSSSSRTSECSLALRAIVGHPTLESRVHHGWYWVFVVIRSAYSFCYKVAKVAARLLLVAAPKAGVILLVTATLVALTTNVHLLAVLFQAELSRPLAIHNLLDPHPVQPTAKFHLVPSRKIQSWVVPPVLHSLQG